MDGSKRSFLKLAGTSVLAGLSAAWTRASSVQPSRIQTEKRPESMSGKKWGLLVDPGKCLEKEGCRDCIEACHQAHNVPEHPSAEESVKWIWKESYEHAFPTQAHRYTQEALKEKPVLVFCNHCENPPCVRVCPTQATWKRDSDGIVMMDQHRCIGCRYCMVACPYGSRSFNWRDPRLALKGELNPDFPTRMKGVVEKCNFCAERLAKGLLPACVETCQKVSGALFFGDLEDRNSEISSILRSRHSIRRKPALGTEPQVYYLV